ncbi:UDP-N-acetylglucosamine--N-acetylmuramyl-(pentapeptide) pyrophosphoryl-undecaprenol N-acetylglucosamine transferase [Patescibacteria group bacterium]|nr:UDP-N-acetylglucosamine--N-acetylmuramyl-(pentapeptide) pyrophosphoryl-undecaprenol N-acetylglucosamine transferase [Patescibacteria group bacterium]
MKIVFTGGGTGGHFYPIIAVAEKVNQIIDKENILGAKLYYMSDTPYDKEMLFENGLTFEQVGAGKMRTYFSFKNFFDVFKMMIGCIGATYKMFKIYPDVVFGKGGYASFPAIFAARVLRIPVMIHESDSAPGRVNLWGGRFANKVAVSFKEASEFFPKKTTAWTGHPIRAEIENTGQPEEALKYFKLESNLPTLLILGGSQGAEIINNTILDALPQLIQKYQIIHQTGVRNFASVRDQADVVLLNSQEKSRYVPMAFLNPPALKLAAGLSKIIVSRAGSTLFEIATWGVPAILVPFNKSNGDHARKNAFTYAHAGACTVIEELNMTANILVSEIDRLIEDKATWQKMADSAKAFATPNAALKIAEELVNMALSHEG